MKTGFLCLFTGLLFAAFVLSAEDTRLLWSSKDMGNIPISFWKPDASKAKPFKLPKAGQPGQFTYGIEIAVDSPDSGGCYVFNPPAAAERGYRLRLKAYGVNINDKSKIHLIGFSMSATKNLGRIPGEVVAKLYARPVDYVMEINTPGGPIWNEVIRIQVTLCVENLKGGKIIFDDIRFEEILPSGKK